MPAPPSSRWSSPPPRPTCGTCWWTGEPSWRTAGTPPSTCPASSTTRSGRSWDEPRGRQHRTARHVRPGAGGGAARHRAGRRHGRRGRARGRDRGCRRDRRRAARCGGPLRDPGLRGQPHAPGVRGRPRRRVRRPDGRAAVRRVGHHGHDRGHARGDGGGAPGPRRCPARRGGERGDHAPRDQVGLRPGDGGRAAAVRDGGRVHRRCDLPRRPRGASGVRGPRGRVCGPRLRRDAGRLPPAGPLGRRVLRGGRVRRGPVAQGARGRPRRRARPARARQSARVRRGGQARRRARRRLGGPLHLHDRRGHWGARGERHGGHLPPGNGLLHPPAVPRRPQGDRRRRERGRRDELQPGFELYDLDGVLHRARRPRHAYDARGGPAGGDHRRRPRAPPRRRGPPHAGRPHRRRGARGTVLHAHRLPPGRAAGGRRRDGGRRGAAGARRPDILSARGVAWPAAGRATQEAVMRRTAGVLGVLVLVALGPIGVARADTLVTNDTGGNYVRAGGGTDATMLSCNTGRRTQNEPSVAVDPRNSDIIVAGSNDDCAEIQNGSGNVWAGYYRSTDGGDNWVSSLVPGYPADTSAFGTASPAHGSCAAAGDPTQSFDGAGHLYYGFSCFNRVKPTNGSIYVARYDNDGASYVRTLRVERGTPSVWGLFQDKINIAADQSTGTPTAGNVYVAWARYAGQAANNVVLFSRSTDGGATFSRPVRLTGGHAEEQFADIAVGPQGAVYVTYREIAHQKSTQNRIRITRSTDGGQTFSAPTTVASIDPFDSTDFGPDTCGDGPFACPSGLTYARFSSLSAVAADADGVHIVWSARTAAGQSKVFARNSADGLSWSAPAVPIDTAATGHQFFPDITTGAGTLSVVFQDSRGDGSYSPDLPPGDTIGGTNSGNVVQAFVATSTNGVSWSETQVSSMGTNPNWEVRGSMRSPFFGDYNYTSAAGAATASVWTDTRDLPPGTDPREIGADDDADGFDGRQTCTWIPNDINAASYSSPTIADPCLSQGGLDHNIYIATAP